MRATVVNDNGRRPGAGQDLSGGQETPSHTEARLSFDRYSQLVCDILGVPAAIVSIVHDQAQVLPGAFGLPEPWQSQRWTPLIHSVCLLVTQDKAPVVIPDARLDERTSVNPAIADLELIAYLGVPLISDGEVVGAICAIDHEPREWSERDVHLLTGLTAVCSAELDLRGAHTRARADQYAAETARDTARHDGAQARVAQQRSEDLTAASQRSERHSRLLLSLSESLAATTTVDSVIRVVQKAALTHLGAQVARFEIDEGPDEELLEEEEGEEADRHQTLSIRLSGTLKGRLRLTWAPGDSARAEAPAPHTHASIVETATALAHYASTALDRALWLQERRSTAATLQHAMLTALPTRGDLELAARYVPAASSNQVGGDWYDAVTLDKSGNGPVAVVIGDVAGHDIEAAATMGQLRSILRGLLIDRPEPPAAMITRLNRAVNDLDISTSASVVLAVVEEHPGKPQAKRLSWANAGHPAPVRVDAKGNASVLPGDPDLLLGFALDWERSNQHADLEPGDTLILYTDGLIERQGQRLAEGQRRLMRSATEHFELPLPEALDRILQDLIDNAPSDDCALLGVRIPVDQ